MKFRAVSQNTGDPTPFIAAETEKIAELVARGVVEQIFLEAGHSGAVLVISASDARVSVFARSTPPTRR